MSSESDRGPRRARAVRPSCSWSVTLVGIFLFGMFGFALAVIDAEQRGRPSPAGAPIAAGRHRGRCRCPSRRHVGRRHPATRVAAARDPAPDRKPATSPRQVRPPEASASSDASSSPDLRVLARTVDPSEAGYQLLVEAQMPHGAGDQLLVEAARHPIVPEPGRALSRPCAIRPAAQALPHRGRREADRRCDLADRARVSSCTRDVRSRRSPERSRARLSAKGEHWFRAGGDRACGPSDAGTGHRMACLAHTAWTASSGVEDWPLIGHPCTLAPRADGLGPGASTWALVAGRRLLHRPGRLRHRREARARACRLPLRWRHRHASPGHGCCDPGLQRQRRASLQVLTGQQGPGAASSSRVPIWRWPITSSR